MYDPVLPGIPLYLKNNRGAKLYSTSRWGWGQHKAEKELAARNVGTFVCSQGEGKLNFKIG
jgi:hypothetical protein